MSERFEMTVKLQVTIPQALALQAMFEHWNKLASWGSSREVAFYVDGDGNFKPKATINIAGEIPVLTDKMREKATIREKNGDMLFDFDPIAWMLHQ